MFIFMPISYTYIKMQTVCGSTVYFKAFLIGLVNGAKKLNLICIIIIGSVFFQY